MYFLVVPSESKLGYFLPSTTLHWLRLAPSGASSLSPEPACHMGQVLLQPDKAFRLKDASV